MDQPDDRDFDFDREFKPELDPAPDTPRRFQFRLRTLFVVMFFVAIGFPLGWWDVVGAVCLTLWGVWPFGAFLAAVLLGQGLVFLLLCSWGVLPISDRDANDAKED